MDKHDNKRHYRDSRISIIVLVQSIHTPLANLDVTCKELSLQVPMICQ